MNAVPRFALTRISFRRQIMLLGMVVVVLLVAVIFATLSALQYTRSAVLRDEAKHLTELTGSMVREYGHDVQMNGAGALQGPLRGTAGDTLSDLSASVLRTADGVEGGFYSANRDELSGYSFPTRPGGRIATSAIDDDERSAVLRAARNATISRATSAQVVNIGSDVALINAAPVFEQGEPVGSAWTVKRLSNIPGTNRFRTYLIAAALGIAALACVILTIFVVRALQSGVRKIEDGLKNLESTLSSQISIDSDPEEIRRIAEAINRLATALKTKIDSEKEIEDRLRHAERLAALGRLIAGVAHEVRNPLATIRLRVQMCQDSGNVEVRESCVVALQEIERLNGMVSRLLSFSRPVRLHTEPTSLERLLEQRLSNFSELARQKNIRLITRFNGKSGNVSVDQNRLGQVFDNVIQNAIEAMSVSGGTLCAGISRDSRNPEPTQDVLIEFNDTGEGIPSEVLGRIFDPFFTTKSAGTGLGLSICHELIQAHGGKIEILSAAGCGTTVRILLPAGERAVTDRIAIESVV